MAHRPMATVLRFEQEQIMSGHSLPRPMNYSLSRVLPPQGTKINPRKRPVVVVDPRAGQGPGIGGFKKESEIGDALAAGHPVYFIGFAAEPAPGQEFLDVVEGQVKFFEEVVRRHPNSPKPMAIGNCQAGYQTLMVAMLRPDLFGPCLVAGSPMSYWQGVHGKNPMRYAGGLLGGSWLTALTSDLGAGRFDGTWLVLNFDNLNPANFLWTKQYEVYEKVDTEGPRYLEFEKWWGDFIQLNGDEIQYLVDELFIGDRLTRNRLQSSEGRTFDARKISSPVVCFTSLGDNISPVQQTLGWILDLYRDVDAIEAQGRTIVYCVDQTAGHLAIFVSSRIGAEEDEDFIQLIDVIDCLPPGLFEMVIKPRKDGEIKLTAENSYVSFEPRTLDDIRAFGRNSPDDDRAFATVDQLSQLNHNFYRMFLQPYVRAMVNPGMAAFARNLHPLRLSYSLFTSKNPFMQLAAKYAEEAQKSRKPVAPANIFWQAQEAFSAQIVAALTAFGELRDRWAEATFYAMYGSPFLQSLMQTAASKDAEKRLPSVASEQIEALAKLRGELAAKTGSGTFDEALVRAILYALDANGKMDSRTGLALNNAMQSAMHLKLPELKTIVRTQAYILRLFREDAIEALPKLVQTESQRQELCRSVRSVIFAKGGVGTEAEEYALARLAKILGIREMQIPMSQPAAAAPQIEGTFHAPR